MFWNHSHHSFFVVVVVGGVTRLCGVSPVKEKMAHYRRVTLTMAYEGNVVICVCVGNYQNTKAVISRKWIQRALHMNEPMNKNDVVFVSDLCQEEREGGREEEGEVSVRRGWRARDGINASDEAQFIKGQDIITWRNGCSTGGHRNAFSGA